MRILFISPYPPQRDGIANYAAQSVAKLMRDGHDVTVLSLQPSAAHLHLDFMAGPRAWLALARRVRGFDKVVLQWHPAFFYRSISAVDRSEVDLAAALALRLAGEVEIWVHEYEYEEVRRSRLRQRAALTLFGQVDRIVFHSRKELVAFREVVPVPRAACVVEEHGQAFAPRTVVTRDEARSSLGIEEGQFVFLCIGFIQRHKGFDRAVTALAEIAGPDARLDVVGSTRLEEPDFIAYLDELEFLTDQDPRAHLHTGYVSDELFDRWILASDAVVLPYREIWSSGVLERAALFDRPVIATRVGSLEEQASGRRVTFVEDDAQLASAMAVAAGAELRAPEEVDVTSLTDLSWAQLQQAVDDRAAARRGLRRLPADVADETPVEGTSAREELTRAARIVRRLPPYTPPPATSTRPGVPTVKRLIRRLTDWQMQPLIQKVEQLQVATANGLDTVAAEISRGGAGTDTADAVADGRRSREGRAHEVG